MSSTLLLILSTLLISLAPISLGVEENRIHSHEANNIESGVHLTLHHVHRNTSKADVLEHDEARVRFFNYRINTNTTTRGRNSQLSAEAILSLQHEGNNSGGVSVPLKPGSYINSANYYVKMGLGTPVNYYNMVVDTGSSITWLQCRPCLIYCHLQDGPIYNPETSKTYKHVPCNTLQCADVEAATLNSPMCTLVTRRCMFEATYGDGSYSVGYLSQDTLTLSATSEGKDRISASVSSKGEEELLNRKKDKSISRPTLAGFTYGCAEDNQGSFGGAAGLIGLARSNLSLSAQLSPKYGYVFSYCLPTSTSIGGGTGTLSIGRSAAYNSPNMVVSYEITPMITDPERPSLYFVSWTGMTVNGKPLNGVSSLQYRNTPTILDSGTVISRIPMPIYEALRVAFVEAMSPGYVQAPAYSILDTCYYITPTKTLQGVPKMSMIFQGGAQLKLGPQNVVIKVEEGVSCLAFAGNSGTGGITIIGNTQQQTSKILYDVTNSKIGFAAGSCD